MKYLISSILIFTGLMVHAQTNDRIKVACIGASIIYGARIENREQNCYPAQLQNMLGSHYQVTNYGVSATTLLRKGDYSYWQTKQYQDALADNPDVVIIDLGGNDAKLVNRIHLDEYEQDYKEFIHSFTQLPSHPRVILLSAMACFLKDTAGIWDPVIVNQVNPKIQKVAYDEHVEVIDMHSPFINKEANMPDKLHPDKIGAGIMAQNVYRVIVQERDKSFDIFKSLEMPLKQSSFYGYECADFIFNGRDCKIAKPKFAAKGHPWVWRARFWGHEPQTDIALLQQGFHIVYYDAAELLGNSEAIADWDSYYKLLRKAGLAKKAVLEGMSRGGVYAFNWAASNPEKVACVYIDNPLLNIPSWAAQFLNKPGAKDDMFLAFKKDYNLTTDSDIMNFRGSPVDKVKQIVKGKYPILILCADADEEVIPQENTLLFEQKVKALNGNITVIHKPGFKHHSHSLPNPAPIVDFILKETGYVTKS
ncbi:GDSL-type esterase/lipase family protein [Mucilaginibacter sp. X5P1]|uniref:GDSL-type esterase/lipase family protein n=1 Tax=Mucilaginibacter sp. X5P1 TaxID=2723088 RepID=UPI0017A45A70|nr:GDSL-type esterase/lipase family protein [Mucilaginibacter sp. X5P1]MBB6140354.1 lysophospholipase L1-like esterase/pimeloyl-ACP methyl ester carboxylesterase [Mucilaginibacter sp. X5P1]